MVSERKMLARRLSWSVEALAMMRVWNRYSRKLGHGTGDFDPDSGTSHAVANGRTLCGVRIGSADKGWERNDYARHPWDATCARCRRRLGYDALPASAS